jgi:predicted nucleic-acid-binding protein
MGCRFVDTNVFIEVFARKGFKSDKSKKLLKEAKNLMTSGLVISEIEWVLRSAYLLKREDISRYIKNIISSKIIIEDRKVLIEVLEYYSSNNVDWSDCFNMFLIKEQEVGEVYSYDKGLAKFGWVKRLEP